MIYHYIQFALDMLATLDATLYPNLYHFYTTTTVFRHLEAILRLFQSKDKPAIILENKAYFLYSQHFIQIWSKAEADCGGTEERWQSHKIFLLDLGLIETYIVADSSDNPVLNRIWEKAKAKGQRSETLWTIPLYDETLLQQAERIASLYSKYRINIAHLRKNDIIRFRGQARANWLYWPDCRIIQAEEATMLKYCHEAIRMGIEKKGYTTFKEMETQVHAFCTGRLYFQQQLAELLNPEEAERQKPYWTALGYILKQKALLCLEVGCEYRQIRKTDRQKISLPDNLKSWFIVPK